MWLSDGEKHLSIGSMVQKIGRYRTLKSVPVGSGRVGSGRVGSVGSLKSRKLAYSAKTRSAFGLARN